MKTYFHSFIVSFLPAPFSFPHFPRSKQWRNCGFWTGKYCGVATISGAVAHAAATAAAAAPTWWIFMNNKWNIHSRDIFSPLNWTTIWMLWIIFVFAASLPELPLLLRAPPGTGSRHGALRGFFFQRSEEGSVSPFHNLLDCYVHVKILERFSYISTG